MLETTSKLIITIAAMAIVCMLMEFLLPKSRLKSCVSIGTGIVFLLAISTPIVALCTQKIIPVQFSQFTSISTGQDFVSHFDWLKDLYTKAGHFSE